MRHIWIKISNIESKCKRCSVIRIKRTYKKLQFDGTQYRNYTYEYFRNEKRINGIKSKCYEPSQYSLNFNNDNYNNYYNTHFKLKDKFETKNFKYY